MFLCGSKVTFIIRYQIFNIYERCLFFLTFLGAYMNFNQKLKKIIIKKMKIRSAKRILLLFLICIFSIQNVISQSDSNFRIIEKNELKGFVNQWNDTVIACQFEYLLPFTEDLAGAKINNKWGFIDTTGKFQIEPQFDSAREFYYGAAIVMYRGKFCFIDHFGRFVVTEFKRYSIVDEYVYIVERNRKKALCIPAIGYITDWFIEIKFYEKYFIAFNENKMAIFNLKAEQKADWYDKILLPSNGMFQIREDSLWGFVNIEGEVVVEPKYQDITAFRNNVARVFYEGKCALINTKGELITDWYEYIYPQQNGNFQIKNHEKIALADTLGNIVSDWFDDIYLFYYGLYRVQKYQHFALASNSGKILTDWYSSTTQLINNISIETDSLNAAFANERKEIISDWFPNGYVQNINFDDYIVEKESNDLFFLENLQKYSHRKKIGFVFYDGEKIGDRYQSATFFNEGVAYVTNKKNQKAILGKNAELVSEWYDEIYPFYNGFARVALNSKMALIDKAGKQVTVWYDYIYEFSDGMAKVRINGLFGFVNSSGELVIPCKYFDATSFSYGLARVNTGRYFAFIGSKGENITHWYKGNYRDFVNAFYNLELKLACDTSILDNWILTTQSVNRLKYVNEDIYSSGFDYRHRDVMAWNYPERTETFNRNHNFFYEYPSELFIFQSINNIDENCESCILLYNRELIGNDKVALKNFNNNTQSAWYYSITNASPWGYIATDAKGYRIIDTLGNERTPVYKKLSYFNNNFILAKTAENKETLIKTNYEAIDFEFESVEPLSETTLLVFQNNLWGVADTTGKILLTPCFTGYKYFNDSTFAAIQQQGKYAIINKNGTILTDWFDRKIVFVNNCAIVTSQGKNALLSSQYKIISQWYDTICPFIDDFAKCMINNEYALLNSNGNIITQWYDYIYPFSEGFAKVVRNGKAGYISYSGNEVVSLQFDDASAFSYGVARIKRDGKYAYFKIGMTEFNEWYDYLYPFDNQFGVAKKQDWYAFVDSTLFAKTERFPKIDYFNYGLYRVFQSNTFVFLNNEGRKMSVTLSIDIADSLFIKSELGYVSVYDTQGTSLVNWFSPGIKITLNANPNGLFTETLTIKVINEKKHFVDINGNVVFEQYTPIEPFFENRAKVYFQDKEVIINEEGEIVE